MYNISYQPISLAQPQISGIITNLKCENGYIVKHFDFDAI